MNWWYDQPRLSAAEKRAMALRAVRDLEKQGRKLSPVKIAGLKIATTFWGKAWCENLESYAQLLNRLERGRTYARNGSVIDLQIKGGNVTALVSGSDIYEVEVTLVALSTATWKTVKTRCAGQIGSLVDLLQGKLSQDVMSVVSNREQGLFPKPKEIAMSCSCPDGIGMCKHIAAVLYGVGARLDEQPELLFALRQVDHLELIAEAGTAAVDKARPARKKTIAAADLSDVFGIELDAGEAPSPNKAAKQSKTTKQPKAVKQPKTTNHPKAVKQSKAVKRSNAAGIGVRKKSALESLKAAMEVIRAAKLSANAENVRKSSGPQAMPAAKKPASRKRRSAK